MLQCYNIPKLLGMPRGFSQGDLMIQPIGNQFNIQPESHKIFESKLIQTQNDAKTLKMQASRLSSQNLRKSSVRSSH